DALPLSTASALPRAACAALPRALRRSIRRSDPGDPAEAAADSSAAPERLDLAAEDKWALSDPPAADAARVRRVSRARRRAPGRCRAARGGHHAARRRP